MSEKERIERQLRQRQINNIRRQNLVTYFHWFSDKYHMPWIKEMVARFKALSEYPLIPCRELALRYTDSRDKEIAAFMGFATCYNGDYGIIKEAMDELGEHPWEWFVNRGFVRLSLGDMQNEKTCGQKNWRIAQMFHSLHKVYTNSECATLGETILLMCRQTLTPLHQYLGDLFKECHFNHKNDELRVLILILSPADGIGLSLWSITQADIKCPLTRDVKAFLGYWWPICSNRIKKAEMLDYFGLSDGDLFVASIAYARLRSKRPDECNGYENRYKRLFNKGSCGEPCVWREHQHNIGFDF